MNEFFLTLLDKVEIMTGIRQLERLQSKPAQLKELIEECSKAANQFPLKEDITKSVLMDAVSSDLDFIGLNVKWVRKVLNTYCQVHGVNKSNQKEEEIDLVKQYEKMVSFWQSSDKDPEGLRVQWAQDNIARINNGEQPVDDLEGIKIMAEMFSKQIAGTILQGAIEVKGGGSKLREVLDYNNIVEPEDVKQERLKAIELKKRYKEENYLPDGNCKETWLPYDLWLKQQTQG